MKHGQGIEFHESGEKAYVGDFSKDKRHGFGRKYYKSGQL